MLLDTDEQTLTDLGIFGKGDAGGIYDVYNHTHTRGGEAVLAQLFRNPLADKEAINRRSEMIAWFARLKVGFPFDATISAISMAFTVFSSTRSGTRVASLLACSMAWSRRRLFSSVSFGNFLASPMRLKAAVSSSIAAMNSAFNF